jgi:putative ABC transport system substrate-binding protein
VLSPGFPGGSTAILEGLVAELEQRGVVVGAEVDVECRYARQGFHTLAEAADELREADTDILIGGRSPEARQCQVVEPTKPVLVTLAGDPVGFRMARSLEAPAWNLTGACYLNSTMADLQVKATRLADPDIAAVGVIWDDTDFERARELRLLRDAAGRADVELHERPVRMIEEIPAALDELDERVRWNIVLGGLSTLLARADITRACDARSAPTLLPHHAFLEAGGVVALEPDGRRGLAIVADQIVQLLDGRDVNDIPFEDIGDATLTLAEGSELASRLHDAAAKADGLRVQWRHA